ncbi:hypothetical protein Tco_0878206 [Tanacetum coccineum]|uniref:Tf2-1-like SH3-like domain-containing protein n=1 Tax=Tanacetum coccineum TaxID=301880 RepID=A0ABQ5BX87_9ASTR
MLVEEESCLVYDTDNEEESKVIYNTDRNDVDESPEFKLLHPDQVPEALWEEVSLDFVLGLPHTQHNKDSVMLKLRADRPFRVQKKINDNPYKIELLGHYNVSASFNVSDLSPYFGDSGDDEDSWTSLSQAGEDDADLVKVKMLSHSQDVDFFFFI